MNEGSFVSKFSTQEQQHKRTKENTGMVSMLKSGTNHKDSSHDSHKNEEL